MVQVNIDLGDCGLTAVTKSRAVRFAAPDLRESTETPGRTITTGTVTVDLVAGIGTTNLEPGPVEVEFAHGLAAAKTRVVVVPDQEEVTLAELLEQTLTYTPPVASQVHQDRLAAEDAADRAEAVGTAQNSAIAGVVVTGPTKTALDATYAPKDSPAFTGTPTGITKSHVGLGMVDNTTDANKPVSTAQAAADAAALVTATGRAIAFAIALG